MRSPSFSRTSLSGCSRSRVPAGLERRDWRSRLLGAQIDRFDRVFFVDLGAVRDSREVLVSIAEAIGVSDMGDGSLLDELVGRLRQQRVLLLLDNFEQVIAAAPAVAGLLARLLTTETARDEPRSAACERRTAVPSPAALAAKCRHGTASAEQLAGSEAVQLFVKRAKAVAPVPIDRRECGRCRRDLSATGWPATGDRACDGANQSPLAGGPASPAGQ